MIRIPLADDHTTFTELLAGALNREPDLCTVAVAPQTERRHPDATCRPSRT
ncbi:hypothetical protein [Cryobacterium sp. GrIS_2_6]|uniref:hypothetical protein n=1 Tax=Cryobacterium sp. GrIS_2_6 TaxID=3162785 RepID=UPI002E0B6BC0|nr:hypothetical protein [Cryobacterium psychrotolerans]